MGVRGVEGMISLGIGYTAIYPLNLQGIVGSTPLGNVLGSYTEAFTAATTGGLMRLGLDIFGAPILYKVNKDIYPSEHVVGEFSKRYFAFTVLTRAAEITGSVLMFHFLDYHTNMSKSWVFAANGKIILPLFLAGEPMVYSALVLRENPLPKAWTMIKATPGTTSKAAKAIVNAATAIPHATNTAYHKTKATATTIAYMAASFMSKHITL